MRIKPVKTSGFTLIEIMIVMAIVGMLASLAMPNIIKARTAAQQKSCIKNLTTIEGVKQTWGLENGKSNGHTPTEADLVGPLLYLKQMPVCPSGGTYEFNSVGTDATCTIEGHTL